MTLTEENQLYQEISDLHALVNQYKEAANRIAFERNQAQAQYDFTVKVLTRIHNLLYPPAFKQGDKTFLFNSPHVHEQMQALSDAIRAIPAELTKVTDTLA